MTNLERARAAVRQYARVNGIGSSLRNANTEGEPQGVITEPGQMVGLHASSEILVKDVAAVLARKFPGFRWALQPNEFGGVLNVFCLDFHSVWGYVIRYPDVMDDPQRRQAIYAARAILARFHYHGTRYDALQVAAVPRDAQGQAIPDVSDLKPTRFTKQAELALKLARGEAEIVKHERGGVIIQVNR